MKKPAIQIFPDLPSLSLWAAQNLADRAATAIQARGQFLWVLNGGSTPVGLFQLLGSEYREQLDWKRIQVYWGDERCVPATDPESCYGQAYRLFLGNVGIPEANLHRIPGELAPVEAVQAYTDLLRRFAAPPLAWPVFDLVLLGMGEDGHTASLFPGSPVEIGQPVLAVTGHYQNRPAERITLTPPVFNSARAIWFMAAGESKAETLARVLSDNDDPGRFPAQRIRPEQGELIWLVDQAAAKSISI